MVDLTEGHLIKSLVAFSHLTFDLTCCRHTLCVGPLYYEELYYDEVLFQTLHYKTWELLGHFADGL